MGSDEGPASCPSRTGFEVFLLKKKIMSHLKSVEGRKTSCSANLMGEEILVGRKEGREKKRKEKVNSLSL